MNDCCYNNLHDPKYVSRGKWVCPECGSDVSLAYVLFVEANKKEKEDVNR